MQDTFEIEWQDKEHDDCIYAYPNYEGAGLPTEFRWHDNGELVAVFYGDWPNDTSGNDVLIGTCATRDEATAEAVKYLHERAQEAQ